MGKSVVKTEGTRTDDESLLGGLYQKYGLELIKYVQSKFGSGPPDPEDVVHASFLKLAGLRQLKNIENPRAYLYAVARHYIIDHHKQSNRARSYAVSVARGADELKKMSPPDAENVLMGKERLAIIVKALGKLPAKQRRLVILNRFDGLTCKEIGARENMKEKAVQKQIERALAKCLDILDRAEKIPPEMGE